MTVRALFPAAQGGKWLRFANPRRVIVARRLSEVRGVLAAAECAANDGAHVVGFVSFEAAQAFDPALAICPPAAGGGDLPAPPPPAWFAVFPPPRIAANSAAANSGGGEYIAGHFRPLTDDNAYRRAFAGAMTAIERGDAYQINLTFPLAGRIIGDAGALFADLARAQPSPWGGFIESEEWALCSASPECFFIRQNGVLQSRPMKGTRALSADAGARRRSMRELADAAKDRAENLMIVDMLRNDMARLADARNIAARNLCAVRAYPTVAQMTSTVTCQTRASLATIFAALFPCASVTGAPKVAAMDFIRALEKRRRGVYCGAIGRIAPGGAARFCVAIRTLWLDRKTGRARYDVGGGVVADSTAAGERAEGLAKARILSAVGGGALIETMRARDGEVALLRRHLRRLQASAKTLGFACDIRQIRAAIANAAAGRKDQIVRLLLAADGRFSTRRKKPPPASTDAPLLLCPNAAKKNDPLLRHKTTRRGVYRRALAQARRRNCGDALLTNECGEITETCIANFAVVLSKRRLQTRLRRGDLPIKTIRALAGLPPRQSPPPLTPPLSCGLLPGVMRAELLARGELLEGKIRADDLPGATLYRLNAVRGMERTRLAE